MNTYILFTEDTLQELKIIKSGKGSLDKHLNRFWYYNFKFLTTLTVTDMSYCFLKDFFRKDSSLYLTHFSYKGVLQSENVIKNCLTHFIKQGGGLESFNIQFIHNAALSQEATRILLQVVKTHERTLKVI